MIRSLALCALLAAAGMISAEEKPATTATPEQTQRLATDQWCWTHDVPKAKCTGCDKKLIPALKKDNDWCTEHAVAESLCVKCDPQAKTRIDALRPTEKPKDAK